MYNCEHSRCDVEQRDGCRDVDVIVLNVRRNAINRNLSRFFFFPPSLKHYIVDNRSCTTPNLTPNSTDKEMGLLPRAQTFRHVHAQTQNRE